MTVLLACPTYRLERETVDALLAIRARAQAGGQGLDLWVGTDNPGPVTPDRGAHNMLHQLRRIRRVFLGEGYDALMIVESDVIPPADALERLSALGADCAYGVYRLRRRDAPGENGPLNLLHRLSPAPGGCSGLGAPMTDEEYRGLPKDRPYPVSGSGLGCVLIRRRVMEEVRFRWEGVAHPDHYFTRDVWAAGFDQQAALRVRCGHKTPAGVILWPPQDNQDDE